MRLAIPTAVLLLSVSALLFSACSEVKDTAEYRAIESDYHTLKRQITGKSKQSMVARKLPVKAVKKIQRKVLPIQKKVIKNAKSPSSVHNHCSYILRDLSKPNAKAIWCIPRMVR